MPASINTQHSSNSSANTGDTTTITTTTGKHVEGNNSNNSGSSSPTVATTAATRNNNMRRCREMMTYQGEISALQTKLHTLQQEQERIGRLAALQTCQNPSMAAYQWSQLHKQERWKKEIVLALLQCGKRKVNSNSTSRNMEKAVTTTTTTTTTTTHLPVPLRLHKWDKKVPRQLRQDRDVVLARLQRHDLFCGIPKSATSTSIAAAAAAAASSNSTAAPTTTYLTIPAPLQKDLPVVLATIRRCPDLLLLATVTPPPPQTGTGSKKHSQQEAQQQSLLELHADSHVEILQSLLEAFRHHHHNHDENSNNHSNNSNNCTGLSMRTSMTRQDFWNHFSTETTVRDNPTVMMQVWQEWVLPGHLQVNETLFGPVLQSDKAFALQLAAATTTTTSNDDNNFTFPANALCALAKTLQTDPQVILAYCAANGQNFLHVPNARLQNSWQVIKAASLQNPSNVLSNLAPHTKKRLRWTKGFLLQLFERLVEINKSSRHHQGSDPATTATTTDSDAAAAAAAKVVWGYCSPEIRQDRQVLMAALRAGGGMQYLLQSSSADLAATSTTMTIISKNKNIKSSNNKQRQGRNNNSPAAAATAAAAATTIPSFLLEQRDLWVDLICFGHLPWYDLPKTMKRDKEFAIACLLHHENNNDHNNNTHGESHNHHQQHQQNNNNNNNNKPLGREMVQTILEHCPHAVTDPRMVVAWIQHYHGAVCSCSFLSSFFYATTTATPVVMSCRVVCPCLDLYLETLPLSTRQNKSLMLRACRVNAAVTLYLPVALQEDRDIVECVLLHSSCPSSSSSRGHRPLASLQYVSAMAQHLYPDLVAQAIRQLPKPPSLTDDDEINGFYHDPKGNEWSIWDVYDDVDEDLWVNREIALAWIERGGAYLHDDFPEDFENDAEIFLEIAASPNNWDDFMFASETLLTDKDFMTKAVQRNGRVLKEAKNGLDKDYDLALIAFAHTENLVNHYNWKCPEVVVSAGTTSSARGAASCSKNVGGDFAFLVDFATRVRTELMCHESFVEFLLCIQLSRPTTTPTATTTTSSESNNRNRHRRNDNGGGNRRRGGGGGGGRSVGQMGSGKDSVTSIRVGGGVRGKEDHRGNKQAHTAAPPPSGGGSGKNGNIHLLAQGAETTMGFTKLVAAYLGIPTGERLYLLRRASKNLARWGF